MPDQPPVQSASWRHRLHEIIFEADTPAGKFFDVALLVAILASVFCVILDSLPNLTVPWHRVLLVLEWFFTILFTVEYVFRIVCVRRPWHYVFSFFGIIDLLAILPTYLSLFFVGSQSLLVIRSLRLLRVFRVFKLARFLSEATSLKQAIWASRAKVTVFITAVFIVVVIMGSAMYVVEGRLVPDGSGGEVVLNEAFNSIPNSMYWAIVTMTTVGYGDVTPVTPEGKFLAAIIMVLGYSFIIIPTGIISAEMATRAQRKVSTQACPRCSHEGHDIDAIWCKFCGGQL